MKKATLGVRCRVAAIGLAGALMGCASSDGGLQSALSLSSQTAAPRENVLAAAPAPKDFANLALVFASDVLQLRTKAAATTPRALP